MKEYDLQKLINNPALVDERIKELKNKKLLFKQDVDKESLTGIICGGCYEWRTVCFQCEISPVLGKSFACKINENSRFKV